MNLEERKFSNTTLSRRKNSKRDCPNCTYMSVRDISKIIRKFEGISEEKSIEIHALDLFYQGKKPIEVAIALNLNAQKTSKLYKDYLKLEGFHKLISLKR